ncbi:Transmembrane amino acid transporter protein [Trichomonas vaginalis G3]|uniref:Transmembrane amino acid transporter protein n=1 Tax=Trichomonas vaginalis (strain ATCC PRA-98 / G3) TaxID=412133 RepID=A2G0T5_TRIV3|nr:Transmembrane amino acid transporter protein [Trichomonas vaginalis G3]|eukprot:XP_001302153.1 Transmembrane amino acid transporter protein [Trichomonas vaginalis G3]
MLGGDLLFNDYRFNINSINHDALLYENLKTGNDISVFSTVMILLICGISNNPFYMSYTFQSGVFQALLCALVALILTQLSFHIFVRTWRFNQENSYPSIWSDVFGKGLVFFPRAVLLIAFISLSSVSLSDYLEQYSDLISYVDSEKKTVFSAKWFPRFVISFLGLIPALCVRRMAGMKYIAIFANVLLLICLICEAILFFKSLKNDGFDPNKEIVYWGSDISGLVGCFDLFSIVFFTHPFVSLLSTDIKNASRNKICSITWITSIVSVIINLAGGYLGYFTYFSNTQDDLIFMSESNQMNVFVIIGKLSLVIKTFISFNMYNYINAISLSEIFIPYKDDQTTSRVTCGLVMWLFSVFISWGSSKLVELLDLIGSVCFILLAFILPSIYYLAMYKFKKPVWSIIAIAEIIVCGFLSGCVMYYKGKDFREEYADCTTIISRSDCAIALLTSSIPNLGFNCLAFDLHCL